jgi:V8-like Glu-specific endopeptidase
MYCVSSFRLASRSLLLVLLLWNKATPALPWERRLQQEDARAQPTPNANEGHAQIPTAGGVATLLSQLPASSRRRNVTLGMGCPEFLSAFHEANVSSAVPYRSFTITKGSGYGYVALHFPQLWIPSGASLVLRAVENVDVPDRLLNLTNTTFPSGQMHSDVVAPPILAKELRVELYRDVGPEAADSQPSSLGAVTSTGNARHCFGFVVDAYDYVLLDIARNITPSNEATCINDNSREAACYYSDSSTRTAYLAARAVARLLIQKEDGKTSACTGWLLGSQGHVITNYHCVNTTAQAAATTVEFMADAPSCSQSCTTWGACPGTVEAISTTLVRANEALDYALLKLPNSNVDLPTKYGFLRLKATQGRVNQEIYIPQHPLYYGKRIAMLNDYKTKTTILSTEATGCNATGYSYNGDTQAGSSGAPVIDAQDHGVIALHHCGQFCANTGIPSISIIADLQAAGVLPTAAVDSGDNKNTLNFPTWQPPEVAPPRTLLPMLTFNGIIQRDDKTKHVGVDQFEFSLPNDAEVSFDVLSAEISDDGKYKDLNGDCQAKYLDAILFLFRKGDSAVVLVNDDDKTGKGASDGSISSRDPYARTFLKAGDYMLAIASMPATAKEAYKGFVTPGRDDPEIYTCVTHAPVGSYRLQFMSSETMTFSRVPQVQGIAGIAGTCTAPANSICAF